MVDLVQIHRRPHWGYLSVRQTAYCATVLLLGLLFAGVPLAGLSQDQATDPVIREFKIPDKISSPHSITVSVDGKVWFAEKVGKNLVMFDFERDRFEIHPLPSQWGNVGPSRIALAPDGNIWFTVRRWANSEDDTWFLGRLEPADGTFRRYMLADKNKSGETGTDLGNISPDDLLVDQDGTVWFLSPEDNKVYNFEPDFAKLHGYPIPTPNSYPKGIATDGNGAIWFTQANANKIAKLVPSSGAFSEYQIPTPFANLETLTVDGANRVWFVELRTNRLGAFYPEDERFYEALIPTAGGLPNAVEVDDRGNVWFLEYLGNKVGVFDPHSAQFREFIIPTFASLPSDLTIDNTRDRLWFSQSGTEAKRLGMLSLTKAQTSVAITERSEIARPSVKDNSSPQINFAFIGLLILVTASLFGASLVIWRRRRK